MGDNIISDHISLFFILLFGISFAIIWKNTEFLGFWSAIIFLVFLVILWVLFF